ncbi:hypothetical protein [Xanthomonas tesorieronis]|uniref:hypothetical protein n=1 Tax=Xanthomonas tesorieronis TaxID=3160839 RepID=UPI003514404A
MTGIKVTPRHGIPLQEVLDCHSMLRGLATNIDGFQTIKGRTNARFARSGHSIFRFRNQVRADRFLRRAKKRLGDVFRFRHTDDDR